MPPIKKKSRGRARAGLGKSKKKANPIKMSTKNRKTKLKKQGILNVKSEKSDETSKSSEVLRLPNEKRKNCQDLVSMSNFTKRPEVFKCPKCAKFFRFKSNLSNHVKNEHSKAANSLPCKECPATCPNQKALDKHIERLHKGYLFECSFCLKTFARSYHVVRHIKQSGCGGVKASELLCEICNTSFTRKDNLQAHLRAHVDNKKYMCKTCHKYFLSYKRYTSHVQKKHTEKKFECDTCGKVTSSRAAIIKHLEIHGEKKFACEICGYSTFTIEVMRRHVLRHTNEKPFKCDLCGQSFIQGVQLRRHLEKHIDNICNLCSKEFKTKSRLLLHMRKHQGIESLTCPVKDCHFRNKEFISESSLEKHMYEHTDRPFSCELCGKSFPTRMNLRRHTATHTLDRPRRCMYCVSARAYVRGEMLLRHVRVRHPAIFAEHLAHVRAVMGYETKEVRVKKSELSSILNLLDAITDRILEENIGDNVLYGGMTDDTVTVTDEPEGKEAVPRSLLTEEEFALSMNKLISQWVDEDTLRTFGWPDEAIDVILEKLIEQCGGRAAGGGDWSRVQRLRENTKHLFLHVLDDDNVRRLLNTKTIDEVIMHIVALNDDS